MKRAHSVWGPASTLLTLSLLLSGCGKSAPAPGEGDGDSTGAGGATDQESTPLDVDLVPAEPLSTDALTAELVLPSGVSRDEVTLSWLRDGEPYETTSDSIPATATKKGEEWTVIAEYEGQRAESSVVIGNSPPVAFDAFIVAEAATADRTLTCVASALDPDGDDLTWTYAWFVNDTELDGASGDVLEEGFGSGDEVRCRITVSDGELESQAESSEVVTIDAARTLVKSVAITPASLVTCARPVCEVVVENADDPGVQLSAISPEYTWVKNGVVVAEATAQEFTSELAAGDELSCRVRWRSSQDLPWQLTQSASATILNAPPTTMTPGITAVAYPGDEMVCTPSGFEDPDCDAQSQFSFAWYVDGALVPGAEASSFSTTDLPGGTRVSCGVTPFDGIDAGAEELSAEIALEPSGFEIVGDTPGSFAGWSVAILDDLNGDDLAELAIGAPLANPGGTRQDAGQVYIVPGVISDATIDLSEVTSGAVGRVFTGESGGRPHAEFLCKGYSLSWPPCGDGYTDLSSTGGFMGTTSGPNGDVFGFALGNLGDMDNDGVGDAVFSAPFAFEFPEVFRGKTYAVSGARLLTTNIASVLSDASTDGYFALGEYGSRIKDATAINDLSPHNGDLFGYTLTPVGDMNGDGLQDFAASSINYGDEDGGRVYVIYGRDDGQPVDMDGLLTTPPVGGFTITGHKNYALSPRYGIGLHKAGDVDGDGYDDLILQAFYNTDYKHYVVFGKAKRATSIDLDSTESGNPAGDPPRVMRITGGMMDLQWVTDVGFVLMAGRSINYFNSGGGGDVNGDGLSDMAFTAEAVDTPNEIVVRFGDSSRNTVDLDLPASGTGGFLITGDVNTGIPAGAVRIGGDLNGDGLDDIVIASANDSVYVIYGKTDGEPVSLDDVALGIGGFQFTIPQAKERGFAQSIDVGDINGDGIEDFLVGAYTSDSDAGVDTGGAFVRFGRDFGGNIDFRGGKDDDSFTGTSDAEVFVSGAGDDVLVGGGGADVLYGGAGDDVLEIADLSFLSVRGGRGTDTLVLASEGLSCDLNALRGRVRDIERISLEGHGSQNLNVERLDLLRLSSSSNELLVMGDADDVVTSLSTTWFAEGTEERLDRTFYRLTNGYAVLLVEEEMETSIAPSLLTSSLQVSESTPLGGQAGALEALDPDGTVTRFTIVDAHGYPGVFTVDESTGVLLVMDTAAIDFETGPRAFTLTVQLEDDDGLKQQGDVSITVTDAPEPPVFTDSALTLSVGETDPVMTLVGAVLAVDPDAGDSVTYSLVGMVNGPLEVDATTGEIVVADPGQLDFETAPTLTFQVEARDSTGLTDLADVTVNVLDATTMVETRTLYFATRGASIWDTKPVDLALASNTVVDYDAGSPGVYRLPFPDAFGEWGVNFDVKGKLTYSADVDFGTGLVDATVPVDVTLVFPDEIAEGASFDLTSSWTVTPDARFVAATPNAKAFITLDKLEGIGFEAQVCGVSCSDPFGETWDYTGPSTIVDYEVQRASLTGQASGVPTQLTTASVEVPFLDKTIPWDSYFEMFLQQLGLPSNAGTMPPVSMGGKAFAYIDYVAFSLEYSIQQTYRQSNKLNIQGVKANLVFTEIDSSVPFTLGGTSSIAVPVGADANLDGRIDMRVDLDLDQQFTTNYGVLGDLSSHKYGGQIDVRSAYSPSNPLYFAPYRKGPLLEATLTIHTNDSGSTTFPLQGFNTAVILGSLDKKN